MTLKAPEGTGLSFQLEPAHVPPAWPAKPGDQQMQIHLDIAVEDLAEAEGRSPRPSRRRDARRLPTAG